MLHENQIHDLHDLGQILKGLITECPLEKSVRDWAMVEWHYLESRLAKYEAKFYQLAHEFDELHARWVEFDANVDEVL